MKITKLSAIIVALSFLGSCEKGGLICYKESGTITTETRDLTGFSEIEMCTQADVYVTEAADYSVVVETSDNLQEIIKTKVKGDRLIIETKNGKCIKGNPVIDVHVSAPNIEALVISGSGNIYVDELLTTQKMKLEISGSGNINVDDLDADELDAKISGSGNILVEGQGIANKQTAKISGSGDITTVNFQANDVIAKISGSGSMTVHPVISLDANISGSGDIMYVGTPTVSTDISGSGNVRPY